MSLMTRSMAGLLAAGLVAGVGFAATAADTYTLRI